MVAKTSLYAVVTEEEKSSHIPHLLVRLAPNLGAMVAHLLAYTESFSSVKVDPDIFAGVNVELNRIGKKDNMARVVLI